MVPVQRFVNQDRHRLRPRRTNTKASHRLVWIVRWLGCSGFLRRTTGEESIADQVVSTKQTLLGLRDNLVGPLQSAPFALQRGHGRVLPDVKRHMLDGAPSPRSMLPGRNGH